MFKKFFKQFKYGQKGFTLIELLVVVAILGVLAAVAIPNVARFVKSGTLAAANTELATVQTAAIAYASEVTTSGFTAGQPTSGNYTNTLDAYLNKPAALLGWYKFDSSGKLIDTAAGGTDPTYKDGTQVIWNATTQQFKLHP